MFPKKIEHPADVKLYDMITVIRPRGSKLCMEQLITDPSLDYCLANISVHKDETVIVIAESPLHGEVYRYGNHGEYWEQIGTVCGYA